VAVSSNGLAESAGIVIGIVVGFIIIQMLGVCLGCVLCQRIARDGYKEV
jgi:putative Ca2+/H+ antiporter (TMEM165/GDT1 family)